MRKELQMIGLIVARSKNNVIGKNGEIPWKIKGEQKQFKELTTGNVVIMGRKSFEEIGGPLPNRKNIIVSRNENFTGENLCTASSLQEALDLAKGEKVYVAGGCGLYEEAIPLVDVMYITEVDIEVEDGDVFFPEFDETEFEKTVIESGGEEVKFSRVVYRRIRK